MTAHVRLDRGLLVIDLGLWTLFYGLFVLLVAVQGGLTPLIGLWMAIGVIVGATLSQVVQQAVMRTEAMGAPRRSLIVGSTVVAIAALNALIDVSTLGRVMARSGDMTAKTVFLFALQSFTFLIWIHGFFAALVWVNRLMVSMVEQERRLARAEAETQKAVLAALRFQVNPHFLFNALNAAAALIAAQRNREAEEVVIRLSDFFRASLSSTADNTAALSDELELLDVYLQIERTRFSDRMTVDVDCPAALEGALVPSLLLQPLAENAVKHAVARATRPVHVQVTAEVEDGRLVLSVIDDGEHLHRGAPARDGEGVGLRNVEGRLKALYGDRGEAEAGPTETGYRARLRFPLEFAGIARTAAP